MPLIGLFVLSYILQPTSLKGSMSRLYQLPPRNNQHRSQHRAHILLWNILAQFAADEDSGQRTDQQWASDVPVDGSGGEVGYRSCRQQHECLEDISADQFFSSEAREEEGQ